MEELSDCCNAPVEVADSRSGITHWYECTKCGKPCDTKPKEEKEND